MRLRIRWALAAPLLLIPLISGTHAAARPTPDPDPAPLERSARAVPGQYIVTLAPELSPRVTMAQLGVAPLFTYHHALHGFAAALTPSQLASVRAFPGVASVEENGRVTVGQPYGTADTGAAAAAPPSWGLDRIDQQHLPLDSAFRVNGTGRGVTAYIVDTGIETKNGEFGGRATVGFDSVGDGNAGQDCNGHGTHVAATTGGATYGVARSASLVSVRVLDCRGEGTWASILAGFDWVAKNARPPAVLNASLGGPSSAAVDDAADAIWDSGVLPVVAAGNDADDACGQSPAGAPRAFTVGATDRRDRASSFSNFGACLELFAPGTGIVSAKLGGGSVAHDGTSMAAPHAAGVAALYQQKHPGADPADIAAWLVGQSVKNTLTSVPSSTPNRLLNTSGL